MLNTTAPLWPHTAANNGHASEIDPWGVGTVVEAQARLWNHLLDANRSFWAFYTPWLQFGAPWLWGVPGAAQEEEEEGMEPATTADGIPDPLELQARSWNHFLDATRNFWSTMTWQVPASPWVLSPTEASPEPEAHEAEDETKVTPLPRSGSRRGKSPKSRTA